MAKRYTRKQRRRIQSKVSTKAHDPYAGTGIYAKGYRDKPNPALVVIRKNGKRVKANTSIKMSLRDLRRLVSGARAGKTVQLKARGR